LSPGQGVSAAHQKDKFAHHLAGPVPNENRIIATIRVVKLASRIVAKAILYPASTAFITLLPLRNSSLILSYIKTLASLPSREILLAMVAGTMQAPIAGFVRQLHQLIARLVYVLKRIEEKKFKRN